MKRIISKLNSAVDCMRTINTILVLSKSSRRWAWIAFYSSGVGLSVILIALAFKSDMDASHLPGPVKHVVKTAFMRLHQKVRGNAAIKELEHAF